MTTKPKFTTQVRGNFIDGRFVLPADPNGEWVSRSPGDFTDELGKVPYSYSTVNEAVGAARRAFVGWRRKTVAERAELLKNIRPFSSAAKKSLPKSSLAKWASLFGSPRPK